MSAATLEDIRIAVLGRVLTRRGFVVDRLSVREALVGQPITAAYAQLAVRPHSSEGVGVDTPFDSGFPFQAEKATDPRPALEHGFKRERDHEPVPLVALVALVAAEDDPSFEVQSPHRPSPPFSDVVDDRSDSVLDQMVPLDIQALRARINQNPIEPNLPLWKRLSRWFQGKAN